MANLMTACDKKKEKRQKNKDKLYMHIKSTRNKISHHYGKHSQT